MIIATGEREKYLIELSNGTAVNFADVTAEKDAQDSSLDRMTIWRRDTPPA